MAYNTRLTCPVQRTVAMIADKYKILVLDQLSDGPKRFAELQRELNGITPKVLTRQVRDLESDGLISRTVFAEVPPRVEYALTDLGNSLRPVLDELFAWATENQKFLGAKKLTPQPAG